MASNIISDQRRLLVDENDDPPTYQDVINQVSNSYGTFIGPTTDYTFNSQQPTVIILGGCPTCKVGMLETEFTCMGVCCAIFLFPLGILCCLACRQRRCNFCEAVFD